MISTIISPDEEIEITWVLELRNVQKSMTTIGKLWKLTGMPSSDWSQSKNKPSDGCFSHSEDARWNRRTRSVSIQWRMRGRSKVHWNRAPWNLKGFSERWRTTQTRLSAISDHVKRTNGRLPSKFQWVWPDGVAQFGRLVRVLVDSCHDFAWTFRFALQQQTVSMATHRRRRIACELRKQHETLEHEHSILSARQVVVAWRPRQGRHFPIWRVALMKLTDRSEITNRHQQASSPRSSRNFRWFVTNCSKTMRRKGNSPWWRTAARRGASLLPHAIRVQLKMTFPSFCVKFALQSELIALRDSIATKNEFSEHQEQSATKTDLNALQPELAKLQETHSPKPELAEASERSARRSELAALQRELSALKALQLWARDTVVCRTNRCDRSRRWFRLSIAVLGDRSAAGNHLRDLPVMANRSLSSARPTGKGEQMLHQYGI